MNHQPKIDELYSVGTLIELDFTGFVSHKRNAYCDMGTREAWKVTSKSWLRGMLGSERWKKLQPVRITSPTARVVSVDKQRLCYVLDLVNQTLDGEQILISVMHVFTRPLPALKQLAEAAE